jgi:hypothetical protein
VQERHDVDRVIIVPAMGRRSQPCKLDDNKSSKFGRPCPGPQEPRKCERGVAL